MTTISCLSPMPRRWPVHLARILEPWPRMITTPDPRELSHRITSTGEKVPTTSPAAERSSESAVSVVQRPLPQTVRTRASSAATNKSRALLAQGNTRSPRLPLLQLPPPPKETARSSPSRRKEDGFTIGGERSAGRTTAGEHPATSTANTIPPRSDSEDDGADEWIASIVEVIIPTEIPNNQATDSSGEPQVSSADTVDVPQGDQHTTVSASSAMVVDESRPTAMQGTIRSNSPPVSEVYFVTSTNARMHGSLRLQITSTQCTSSPVIAHCLAISKNKANTLLHFETLKRNLAHPRAACVYSCASDDPIDDCSDSRYVVIVNADSYSIHYTSIIYWCLSYL